MAERKPLTAEQKDRNREYNNKYKRENKVGISIRLNRVYDAHLIEVYQSIPNKAEWFREALREYAEKHPQ